MERKVLVPLCFAGLALTCACVARRFNPTQGSSQPFHFPNRLVSSRNSTQWIDASLDGFKTQIESILAIQGETATDPVISAGTPLASRMQKWVDAMDTRARESEWGQSFMEHVPKIKTISLNLDSANAFSAGMYVKHKGQFYDNGASGSEKKDVKKFLINDTSAASASFLIFGGILDAYPAVPGHLGELAERIKFSQQRAGRSCVPEYRGKESVEFKGCDSPFAGTEFWTLQTSPFLTIHDGLARKPFTEEQVVAILAHEMGHLYRAHSAEGNDVGDGFFYEEKNAGNANTPPPIQDAGLEKKGRELIALAAKRLEEPVNGLALERPVLRAVLLGQTSTGFFSDGETALASIADKYHHVPGHVVMVLKCKANHSNPADCVKLEELMKDSASVDALKEKNEPSAANGQLLNRLASVVVSIAPSLKFVSPLEFGPVAGPTYSGPTLFSSEIDSFSKEISRTEFDLLQAGKHETDLLSHLKALSVHIAEHRARESVYRNSSPHPVT